MPETFDPQAIMPVIQAYINAPDLETLQQVLEKHKRVLLSDTAEEILAAFLAQMEKDGDRVQASKFKSRLELLRDCKKHGIKTIMSLLRGS